MDRFVKLLVFSEDMRSVLLEKGPQFTPLTKQLDDSDARAQIFDYMHSLTGMRKEYQPNWTLVRREIYSKHNTEMWIVFGKMGPVELTDFHRKNPNTVIISTAEPDPRISLRLMYILPLIIVYDRIERDQWPMP
jgi:hypothetical protein